MAGWDVSKLNDPAAGTSIKYQFGRFLQDKGFNAQSSRGQLANIVKAFNEQYGTNASVIDDDEVDFGFSDPIDVINGNGYWQWVVNSGGDGRPGRGGQGGGRGGQGGGGGQGTIPNQIPQWILDLFGPGGGAAGDVNAPQPVDPFTDDFPVDVGQDPFSEAINSALAGLLTTGGTQFGQGTAATIQDLIGRGGLSPDVTAKLLEARETTGLAQEGMVDEARGTLADLGQLSIPGVEQGGTNATVRRISEQIAPDFASAIRGIYDEAIQVSDDRLIQTLSLATGMSAQQAQNILAAAGTGTQRQQMIAGIALDTLAQNIQWSQFLAEFGLTQAQVLEQMRQGRMQQVITLVQLFLRGAEQAAGGFVD